MCFFFWRGQKVFGTQRGHLEKRKVDLGLWSAAVLNRLTGTSAQMSGFENRPVAQSNFSFSYMSRTSRENSASDLTPNQMHPAFPPEIKLFSFRPSRKTKKKKKYFFNGLNIKWGFSYFYTARITTSSNWPWNTISWNTFFFILTEGKLWKEEPQEMLALPVVDASVRF